MFIRVFMFVLLSGAVLWWFGRLIKCNDAYNTLKWCFHRFNIAVDQELFQLLWSFFAGQLFFRAFEHLRFQIIETSFCCLGACRCWRWIVFVDTLERGPFCDGNWFDFFFTATRQLQFHLNFCTLTSNTIWIQCNQLPWMCFSWLMNWLHDRLKRPNRIHCCNRGGHDVWTSQPYRRNQHQHLYSLLSCLHEVDSRMTAPVGTGIEISHCQQSNTGIQIAFTHIFIEFIDGCADCALWHTSSAHIEERVFGDGTFSTTSWCFDWFIVERIGTEKCWPSWRWNTLWRKWPIE